MQDNTQRFCEELVRHFDELTPILQEHVTDYGEILSHVFMGDVTRYVLSGGSQRQGLVQYLNDILSKENKDVQDLIAVSFVENLESEEEFERASQNVRADALRKEWRRQHQ